MKITGYFEHFQRFNFEIDFLKKNFFFEKLEYRFLVESTTMQSAILPYKTALLKVKVNTNKIVA